jgi:signal transduction histidine kinase/ketosteroid isomerase-like protein
MNVAMQLTKQQEAEIWQVYNTWLTAYLNADIKTYDSCFDDDYHFIGSTNNEEFLNRNDTTTFFERTCEQFAGITDLRNEIKILESFDTSIFLTHFFDAWFLNDKDWTYYGRFRFSSVMQKKKEGWRFIYQHFSMPDSKSDEGETIGFDKVNAENIELKEAIKRRTIELESKNRELEVETALERVRARTMGMHKSDELKEVVKVIFDQLAQLNINAEHAGIVVDYEPKKDWHFWVAETQDIPAKVSVPYLDLLWDQQFTEAKKTGALFFTTLLNFEEKNNFYKILLPHIEGLTEEARHFYFSCSGLAISTVIEKDIGLYIENFSGTPYSAEENDILKRFGKVFQQAYTRFVDLQKAEAQAREAQIEAALEKVRSRSLSMHKSGELQEVIHLVFDRLNNLGLEMDSVSIMIPKENKLDVDIWVATPNHIYNRGIFLPYTNFSISTDIGEARSSEVEFFSKSYSFQEKNAWWLYVFEHTDFKLIPEERKIILLESPCFIQSVAFATNIEIITTSYTDKYLTDDEAEILKKFARVFDQAYTRFLDLQKAEEQAREAEIEVALEKVRSRSLAMHKSDDLKDVVFSVFERLRDLQIQTDSTSIAVYHDESAEMELWAANDMNYASKFSLPMTGRFYPLEGIEARKEQKAFLQHLPFEEKNRYWKELFETPDFQKVPDARKNYLLEKTDCLIQLAAFGKVTGILLIRHFNNPFSDADIEITERFAKVFDQTYTRFLDLLKAEAQAREAQIQLSLERIRAKAMAMQHSDELGDFLTVVFEQFEVLNLNPVNCLLSFFDIENNRSIFRMTGKKGATLIATQEIDLDASPVWKQKVEDWKSGHPNDVDVLYIPFENLPEIANIFKEILEKLPEGERPLPEDYPNGEYIIDGYCKYGYLGYASSRAPSDEEKEITRRIANEFGNVYQRFLDLEKAEAQAREAEIQLALERVRARTMAMQKSDELAEASYVLDQQVRALGIETWGCAFHIYTENTEGDHEWFSSANGNLPFYKTPREEFFRDFYERGKRGEKFYVKEFAEEECKEHYDFIKNIPIVGDSLKALEDTGVSLPNYQIDHIAFFSQGYILFITYKQVPEAHPIFQRFASVFEQTYTRFLDLQKAEAQAREAQIENALEKVRSRTMAMQRSDELTDVAGLLFNQVSALGIKTWTAGFNVWSEDNNSYVDYLSLNGEIYGPNTVHTEKAEALKDLSNIRKSGVEFDILYVEGKKIKELYLAISGIEEKEYDKMVEDGLLPSHQYEHFVFGAKVSVMFITYEPVPEAHDIFKRLGKVFEQTYTRFLDLSKAEEQAREARIEAALERVRSRTMGMQRSEQLGETASLLFNQFGELGIHVWSSGFQIWNADNTSSTAWMSSAGGDIQSTGLHLPHTEDPYFINILKARHNPDRFFVMESKGKELEETYRYMFNIPEWKKEFGDMEALGYPIPTYQITHCVYFTHGYLMLITHEPYPEYWDVFKRFGKVFDQTYTRFLDLQKAEAQAREAKIEGALEKIRSRTMGMQSSEELPEVANLFFTEVRALGIHAWSCGYNILAEDKKSATCCMSSEGTLQTPFQLRLWGEKSFDEMGEFVLSDNTLLVQELAGQALEAHYGYMKSFPDLKPTFDEIERLGLSLPVYQINHLCKFNGGFILFITYEKVPDAHAVFKRFTNVFDQTYTRFLDLKKAEKQAWEANLEAALERVRGKAMAMHNTSDLLSTAGVLFAEIRKLGINSFRSGVGLLTKQNRQVKLYSATTSAETENLPVVGWTMMEGHEVLTEVYERWLRKEDFFPLLKGDSLKSYYQRINSTFTVPEEQTEQYEQYGYFLSFSEGMFYGWSEQPFTEDQIQILHRFNSIVDLTFRRYLELQRVEATALEALRSASLDRVRAEIASMRTTKDLERITPLIWKELTTLGIPFLRCGVFIMDEQEELIHTYLSTPDGKAIAAFHLPYTSNPFFNAIEEWRAKKIHISHWDIEEFSALADSLVKEGQITNREQYLNSVPKGGLYLHYVPFLQGIVYVGNTVALTNENLQLVQTVADAFSTAYARYEDFTKLEQAKTEVESAMSELKSTQSQLVQQEKLASLGQLTAGIAHEIKNPLNFVNNFSEVSIEMIEEVLEARSERREARGEKQDLPAGEAGTRDKKQGDKWNESEELEDEILEDIKANLKKIHEHGSRANGIVTSMLQHSRGGTGKKEPTDLNALIKEYVNLSFHGMRAGKNPINVEIILELDPNLAEVSLIKEDFTRVIINLCNNAFDAMRGKLYQVSSIKYQEGTHSKVNYLPKLRVSTNLENGKVTISFGDNGPGIPDEIKDKILQPFFTTKKGTEGTGLGLSITHDIIKAHGGELRVETKVGEGTGFLILLPFNPNEK